MQLSREKIIRSRERIGLTQRAASEETGLHVDTLVNAEKERNVSPTTARKLAAALGVPVADLILEPNE